VLEQYYERAGGRCHLRTIDDATRVLGPSGLLVHPVRGARVAPRIVKTAREAAWMAAMDWTPPLRLGKNYK